MEHFEVWRTRRFYVGDGRYAHSATMVRDHCFRNEADARKWADHEKQTYRRVIVKRSDRAECYVR